MSEFAVEPALATGAHGQAPSSDIAVLADLHKQEEAGIIASHREPVQHSSPELVAPLADKETAAINEKETDIGQSISRQGSRAETEADSGQQRDIEKVRTLEQIKSHEEAQYVTGFKLAAIVACLMLAVLCLALDNTIIAVAIPKITDQFNALEDVGWYGSAYLLTTCAFQLFFGRLYTMYNVKWVFLVGLFLFELGSLICGVSPTSNALIVGRAIAGVGASGLFSGALVIVANITPLEKRPQFLGSIAGMFGIASVAGPLLGGAFTDNLTWRWCFYINLPLGAVTAVGIFFFVKIDQVFVERTDKTIIDKIMRFDPFGTTLFVGAVVCLLLALQWGGTTYPWSDGKVVALFVLFGVFIIGFGLVQWWLGENATVPSRILKQRSIQFGALFSLCIGSTFFIMVYFLPIWFQAITGVDAVTSGIHILPMMLAQVSGVMSAGILTTRFGYYMPFVIASSILLPIGVGLINTFNGDTGIGRWLGYEIIVGLGSGLGFQQTPVAAQTVLPLKDIPIGMALVLSIQILGGAVFISVGENVFTNRLVEGVLALDVPGITPAAIVQAGATNLRSIIPAKFLPAVTVAYNAALVKAFQVALIMSCLAILGAAGMEWKSVKKAKRPAEDSGAVAAV